MHTMSVSSGQTPNTLWFLSEVWKISTGRFSGKNNMHLWMKLRLRAIITSSFPSYFHSLLNTINSSVIKIGSVELTICIHEVWELIWAGKLFQKMGPKNLILQFILSSEPQTKFCLSIKGEKITW